MPQLQFYLGDELVQRVTLGESEITVGRGVACTVQLPDPSVSRLHAVVRPRARRRPGAGGDEFDYEIEDRSMNGTWLNGERIDGCAPLQPGDRLAIERFTILHLDGDMPTIRVGDTTRTG